MNRNELIDAIAAEADIPKGSAEKALVSLVSNITQALKKGDKVTLIGFGTFAVSKRKARTGRNPRTGEAIKIQASNAARFTPGKALKDDLN